MPQDLPVKSQGRTVTMLLLEEPASDVAMELLDLAARSGTVGAAGRVATEPGQLLHSLRGANRSHVLVIDGMDAAAHDVAGLIRYLKTRHRLGIVVVVEQYAQQQRALAAGADLCVQWPVREREFWAHVRHLLERHAPATLPETTGPAAPCVPCPPPPQDAPWVLDREAGRLAMPNGQAVALNANECRFLGMLFGAADRCVQWPRLGHEEQADIGSSRALAIMVDRLCRKCLDAGCMLPLHSDWWYGYVFFKPCAVRP